MPRLPGRTTPPKAAAPVPASPRALPRGRRRSIRRSLPSAASAERKTLGALAGIVLTLWLVAVFGRALADSNALEQRQIREEATNAILHAQVAAGRDEIAYLQTDRFLQFEARSYGMGASREHAFALEAGAPEPRPITPLGSSAPAANPSTPLDDWLKLLFGT